ncbi:hypothetical protein AVEN_34174-1 [Araneus ventricosus]|uniref:Uncharacterized protein n=1 Tax=Araneus ventricosus TaxID=182803 RepID=A0A4Y2UQV3_ARAVE|nr:hypothetical protein AVEN_34174-1 [Araneus ventricosus]
MLLVAEKAGLILCFSLCTVPLEMLAKTQHSTLNLRAAMKMKITRQLEKQDLKQRALAKWQRRWDDSINGRSTYQGVYSGTPHWVGFRPLTPETNPTGGTRIDPEVIKKVGLRNHNWPRTVHPAYHRARAFTILSFPIRKTSGQLLCLWRSWHASSLCHQVPPQAFLPPQVSSRSTHRSLDEINNQSPPANK